MPIEQLAAKVAKLVIDEAGETGVDYREFIAIMESARLGEDLARSAMRSLHYAIDTDGHVRPAALLTGSK